MQIDIDFDVFKELTARRRDESDSYNEVIRRLLGFPATDLGHVNALEQLAKGGPDKTVGLNGATKGVWYSNVFFPNGSRFRATYKGRTYSAEIRDEQWIDHEGHSKNSPSDAAGSISRTNVNGWRFWYVKRPQDDDWVRMDELKS
jgi:hypothetical protein